MSLPGWCDLCNHKWSDHGDRAVGHCTGGTRVYPLVCDCNGYTNTKEGVNGPAQVVDSSPAASTSLHQLTS